MESSGYCSFMWRYDQRFSLNASFLGGLEPVIPPLVYGDRRWLQPQWVSVPTQYGCFSLPRAYIEQGDFLLRLISAILTISLAGYFELLVGEATPVRLLNGKDSSSSSAELSYLSRNGSFAALVLYS